MPPFFVNSYMPVVREFLGNCNQFMHPVFGVCGLMGTTELVDIIVYDDDTARTCPTNLFWTLSLDR